MVLERLASSVLQDAFGKREETKTTYYDEKRTRALAAFNLVPGSYRIAKSYVSCGAGL